MTKTAELNDIATETTRPSAHRIRRLAIVGGFLDGAVFDFSSGLNCIIGARGAGKTTVLELIRFALDAFPGGENGNERRRLESLIEKNLGGGRVELTIENKDGLAYVVHRCVGEPANVFGPDGKSTGIRLKSHGFFRADIFSQNEIETLAEHALAQLSLIDNFDPERITELNTTIRQLRSESDTNAAQILTLDRQVDALTEEVATLAGIEQQLREFASDASDGSREVNLAHAEKSLRDRQQRALSAARQSVQDFAKPLNVLRNQAEQLGCMLNDPEIVAGKNAATLHAVAEEFRGCRYFVMNGLEAAQQRLAGLLAKIDVHGRTLQNAHSEQELAFRQLIEKHRHAQAQSAQRVRLERRRNELLAKQKEREQYQLRRNALGTQRTTLLRRLQESQDERFNLRQAIVQRLNAQLSPVIRITISQSANCDGYRRLLEESLRTARLRHLIVAQKLAETLPPIELARILWCHDMKALESVASLNSDQTEKVFAALSSPEVIFQLETVELSDLPRIELKDGSTYKDSSSLSTGQKCTTILPILLLEGESPLLVDQPEDNLDNRFIFETVVESIRRVKRHRQLIFVTHNPNIPVLGDADHVVVLDSDGQASRQAHAGTVDDVKSQIVTLLEGGEDAFKARKHRYAY